MRRTHLGMGILGWKMAERRFFRLVLLPWSRACSRQTKSSSLMQEMLHAGLMAEGLLHTHCATSRSATVVTNIVSAPVPAAPMICFLLLPHHAGTVAGVCCELGGLLILQVRLSKLS